MLSNSEPLDNEQDEEYLGLFNLVPPQFRKNHGSSTHPQIRNNTPIGVNIDKGGYKKNRTTVLWVVFLLLRNSLGENHNKEYILSNWYYLLR